MSIQDLRPNPLDTSIYVANIYQILANPNFTVPRTSIPSPALLPPFSPPRYAVWVNSLWVLSLVISLTCALLATSLHQWARRYIRVTQPARCSPEKRARMRAFFSDGVNKKQLPWAVETLPALIHVSLFLFFGGVVIFLFNINHSVFTCAIWWIGLFSMIYGWITLMPVFRHDSPYYTPLSSTAWSLHTFMAYALFTIFAITFGRLGSPQAWELFRNLSEHYSDKMLGGLWKATEDAALEQSLEIDLGILDWTIGALGEDDTLEKFYEVIPGFLNSQMVDLRRPLPDTVLSKFVDSLKGFCDRTLSSNSVSEEVKIRRLVISTNATAEICDPADVNEIFFGFLRARINQLPQSIQIAQILAPLCICRDPDVCLDARQKVARILLSVRERDDRWIVLAKNRFGLPEHVLRNHIAYGDNSVLLSILIHVARQVLDNDASNLELLSSISGFDMRNTHAGLQTESCALWNETVLKAKRRGIRSYPVLVLRQIRQAYIAIHQGTGADLTSLDASVKYYDPIFYDPSTYPLCNITTHVPDSNASSRTTFPSVPLPIQIDLSSNITPNSLCVLKNQPIHGNGTTTQEAEGPDIIPGLPSYPPRSHEVPSSSQATDLVPVASQISSNTVPPTNEPTEAVSLGITPLLSMEAPYPSRHAALSAADLSTNIMRHDEQTSEIPNNEVPQTPVSTSLTVFHPNHVLTVAPSALPHLPTHPGQHLQHPGAFPDTPQLITSTWASPHRLDSDSGQCIVAPHTTSNIVEISPTTDQIPLSVPDVGTTLRPSEDLTSVPLTVSGPQMSLNVMPSLHGSVNRVELASSVEPTLIQRGHILHALHDAHPPGSRSSSLTVTHPDSVSPRVTTVLDAHVTTSIDASSTHNTRDPTRSIPMEVLRHENQSLPSTSSITEHLFLPRDRSHD